VSQERLGLVAQAADNCAHRAHGGDGGGRLPVEQRAHLGIEPLDVEHLRQLGAQFAEKYPKIASRLILEPDKCEDPHVERMLEAFAFLAARVHLKIDDEFPELTDALLGVLYPHFLSPIPSMAIVQFELDPAQAALPNGFSIERNLDSLGAELELEKMIAV